MSTQRLILLAGLGLASAVHAQSAPPATAQTAGTLVIVPASAEVTRPNDEAYVTFVVEEQDEDRVAATSRVNQKMKEGTAIVRAQDPQAQLKTTGYYTAPVYPNEPDNPRPLNTRRVPIGWHVTQTLQVTTRNLAALPNTVAAAQKLLNLDGLNYHLSSELARKLDEERIAATYRNLNQRIAAIARAMGRNLADATVETVDFDGNEQRVVANAAGILPRAMAMRAQEPNLPEPSFEPGETTLDMHVVGKVRFR
jgi:predicted secreted protein